MKRSLPIIPTLIVLIAVGIMIRLGFWQLERLHQKEAMLAQFAHAQADRSVHPWNGPDLLVPYGLVSADCSRVMRISAQAGENTRQEPGWVQVADCGWRDGGSARVVLGWSARPEAVRWAGGPVTGTYLKRDNGTEIVVADPPLEGLEPNARPDPRDLPNNHLAYAVQWFAFAAVALVIYALAVRKRMRP